MSRPATPTSATEAEPSNMSILAHLNDLRIRLTYAAIGLFVCTVISFIFAEPLLEYLMQPYIQSVPNAVVELQALRPTEGIETFFKVSIMAGAILAMPFILIQLWLFIKPGLNESEKKYVYIFVPSATLLFMTGISFAWFILVPAAINFLANFMADIFRTDWTGQEYISFVVRMLFWIGVSFEMPVIMYFLGRVGIVTSQMLREQWRVAVVGTAVLAAIITPSIDPVTMMLTMGPLFILYLISIGTAGIGQRQFARTVAPEG
jgi:sec-independent protein translocase protein TatC